MYSLALFLLFVPFFAEAKSKCQGIVWSRDETINMCLAKHCGKAIKDDRSTPDFNRCNSMPMIDFFTCGGGMNASNIRTCSHKMQHAPPKQVPGVYVEPTTTPVAEPLCPKGEFCLWGPFEFGYCCDEKNEEVWNNDYAAKCPSKMRTVNVTQKGVNGEVLRGKSCKDNFCPKGSKCIQGRYLAHCCV